MKLFDTVRWTSQSAASVRTKEGVIIEVVPPTKNPKSKLRNPGMWRDHWSYVVKACVTNGSEGQRKTEKLYWPKVKYLEIVLDSCEICKGVKGGTPGNENVIDGVTVCDYCHADESYKKNEVNMG